ncbi:maleylpyruvate isomerase family mycothiol-dependent enzyme [Streptomyces gilvosporeus]|uniref:Maleylpyruvate isomerase family mycothiol-dependent enzyme n=1 Tax=Streptomyces gilvosporeus TaxID=553510 RepID=A0A1V0TTZ3_9ACTN|nr:maleylpyruvate isomerase family mycothiol-dependent enzyme [Streptomyces gilvosporeus]ARF56162.1 hypothetical protein B1H19_20020 [Streptomyces gilvosporeus]
MAPTHSKSRTRTYDSAKTRAAVVAQLGHVRAAVSDLTPDQLALPTRLGGWTVRELAAHLSMGIGSVARILKEPEPPKVEVTLPEWPLGTAPYAAGVDEYTRALAADNDPAELLDRTAEDFLRLLPEQPGERLVAARSGAMRLDDYLVTRCIELIVHTDDLVAATGVEVPYDRQALATATRLLADALAVKAPGGSVEVRVPPFAVVQCVEGPRHTRGTPPNVVETDPLTWLRLATGRTTWGEALEAAAVSASGERADISGLLPILS